MEKWKTNIIIGVHNRDASSLVSRLMVISLFDLSSFGALLYLSIDGLFVAAAAMKHMMIPCFIPVSMSLSSQRSFFHDVIQKVFVVSSDEELET